MAFFSLHMSFIGKSKQAQPYTASAHISYITREQAASAILGARMPLDPEAAMEWMDHEEDSDRRNARMIDKLIVALPIELDLEQHTQLVTAFGELVSRGKVPWMAAIHATAAEINEKGQFNPHAHIIIRDRDQDGKRVLCTSDNIQAFRQSGKPVPDFYEGFQSVADKIRHDWEQVVNQHLELAGLEVRVDRRSLKEQGIDRQAQIHVGVAASQMMERGVRPESKLVQILSERSDGITINYPEIDQGKTRFEANEDIKARNLALLIALEAVSDDRPRPTGPLHTQHHGAWPQQWEDRQGMAAQQGEALKWSRDHQAPGRDPNHAWTEIRPSRPELPPEEPTCDPDPLQSPQEERQAKTEQTTAQVEKQAKRERQEGAVDKAWLDAIISHRSERNMDDDGGMEM